jgi:hypothetical protein
MKAENSSLELDREPKPAQPRLHIMEGGFKPRLEILEPYLQRYGEFLQFAMVQAGFRESYGGPFPNSPWWLAVSKFASLEDMERFHLNATHVKVQDEARDKWWTAYYIRKGRLLGAGESASGQILCETAILRDSNFSKSESDEVENILTSLSEMGIVPYQTLAGETIARPYLLGELAGNTPTRENFRYILLSYWPSTAVCDRWVDSRAYRELGSFGALVSNSYQIIPERRPRMMLRPDRMQREWVTST